jgi:hypothetical protein
MRPECVPIGRRTGGRLLVLVGLAHLLLPDLVLDLARTAYGRTLDVVLLPRDGATRRVRLAGVALVALGLAVARGDQPGERRST